MKQRILDLWVKRRTLVVIVALVAASAAVCGSGPFFSQISSSAHLSGQAQ